jgi:hypothetical protein
MYKRQIKIIGSLRPLFDGLSICLAKEVLIIEI